MALDMASHNLDPRVRGLLRGAGRHTKVRDANLARGADGPQVDAQARFQEGDRTQVGPRGAADDVADGGVTDLAQVGDCPVRQSSGDEVRAKVDREPGGNGDRGVVSLDRHRRARHAIGPASNPLARDEAVSPSTALTPAPDHAMNLGRNGTVSWDLLPTVGDAAYGDCNHQTRPTSPAGRDQPEAHPLPATSADASLAPFEASPVARSISDFNPTMPHAQWETIGDFVRAVVTDMEPQAIYRSRQLLTPVSRLVR